MKVLLGIDIGTSSVKAMLLDVNTGVIDVATKNYEVNIPKANYAEQDPEMWWEATISVLQILKNKYKDAFDVIAGIGFSGQMHGLVITDCQGNPLRPAIIWLDQRSNKQVAEINSKIDFKEMGKILHNNVFTGCAFPSLLWIKENEPDIFSKIYKILHPKDYIRLKIIDKFGTDVSDASASLCFDVSKRDWAWDILERFEIPRDIFSKCHESIEIAGVTTKECARQTGLKVGIPVIYGSADQPAQSIGNGAIREGIIVSNIGTGGQVSTYVKEDEYDSDLRTHTFCHAMDKAYTIYGAALSSGMSLNWLKNKILNVKSFDFMSTMAKEITPCSEGLIFLPYLSGERTPHMNSKAKGMFFGLKLGHDRRHLVKAVMEGVVFSLKDSLEIFNKLGLKSDRIIASGGGASSSIWLQIQADIFEKEIQVSCVKEQACLGACIMAGLGTEIYRNVKQACDQYIEFDKKIYIPKEKNVLMYREIYKVFKKLYENTKELL